MIFSHKIINISRSKSNLRSAKKNRVGRSKIELDVQEQSWTFKKQNRIFKKQSWTFKNRVGRSKNRVERSKIELDVQKQSQTFKNRVGRSKIESDGLRKKNLHGREVQYKPRSAIAGLYFTTTNKHAYNFKIP